MSTLSIGMPPLEVEQLFGSPDISFEMAFGEKTEKPWSGLVFKYYTIRDHEFKYAVRYKTNTLVFDTSNEPAKLHHWILEHVYSER